MDQQKNCSGINQAGFTLLEALIALVVFSVGLVVIAQFHGSLMRASGESKASSEALYIAQAQIDELRSLEWTDLMGVENEIPQRQGTNDTFTITRNISTPSSPNRALVTVTVEGSEIEPVQLHTWISRISNINLAQSDGDGILGNYPLDKFPEDVQPIGTVDGFLIRGDVTPDGRREITEVIDPETGDFLQLPNGGARISGTVFFHSSSSNMNEASTLQISATGNTICRKFTGANRTASQIPTMAIDSGNYNAIGYSCIVSNGWLGSISTFTPAPDKVCVGSPTRPPEDDTFARGGPEAFSNGSGVPTQRRYFGIGIGENNNIFETGIIGSLEEDKASIGTVCPIGGDCQASPLEVFVPGGHHFLVLDGASSCDTAMLDFSADNVAHSTLDFDDPYNPNNPFYDNPAGLYCTTRPTCGAVTYSATTFRTRMSGFAETGGDVDNADVGFQGGLLLPCQSFGFGIGETGGYWCPVRDPVIGTFGGNVKVAAPLASDNGPWFYRIERNNSGEIIEKLTGADSESLDTEWLMDFTGFGFSLIAREVDDDDSVPETPPEEPESCITEISGSMPGGNHRVDVVQANGTAECTTSGNRYSCTVDATEGTDIVLELARVTGQGSNLIRDVTVQATCSAKTRNFD